MQQELFTRKVVCEHLQISREALLRYEELGLIRPRRRDGEVRYGWGEIRQAWAVVSLHRDLGINLAGVEAILRLRRQLHDAQNQVRALLDMMEKLLAEKPPR